MTRQTTQHALRRQRRSLAARSAAGALALTLAAGLAALAPAASTPTPLQPDNARSAGRAPFQSTDQVIEFIRFDGGTVDDYTRMLRETVRDQPLNIIVSPDALRHQLAPITLSRVTIEGAVEAVRLADAEHRLRVDTLRPVGSAPIYQLVLQPSRSARAQPAQAPAHSVIILSVHDLIEPLPGRRADRSLVLPLESVLSGIEAAITVADDDHAELRYHEDSHLLILRGTPDQLNAAEQAASLMRRDLDRRRAALEDAAAVNQFPRVTPGQPDPEARRADLAAQLYTANIELRRRELDLASAQENVARAQQLAERQMISQRDVREAQLHLERTRLDIQLARADVERLDAQLRFLAGEQPSDESRSRVAESAANADRAAAALAEAKAALAEARASDASNDEVNRLIDAVASAETALRDAQIELRLAREQARPPADNAELLDTRRQMDALAVALDQSRAIKSELEREMLSLRERLVEMEVRARAAQEETAALRDRLNDCQKTRADLLAELERAKARVTMLEAQLQRPNPRKD